MPLVRSPNTHGFFTHIPKCAGTSITKSLLDINCALFLTNQYKCRQIRDYRDYIVHDRWIPNREYPCSHQHWQADLINQFVNVDKLSFVFTMIRDPLDRILSEYRFRKGAYCEAQNAQNWKKYDLGTYPNSRKQTDNFSLWLNKNYEAYLVNNYVWDNHFRPQIEFIVDNCSIFLYPYFEPVADFIQEKIGKRPNIPYLNKSENYDINVSTEDRKLIEMWYNKDYELLKKVCK